MEERCQLCGCRLHRSGDYAQPTVRGRSHATAHHHVAERFFGRSKNRRGTQREPLFQTCPWNVESQEAVFCYECHEELLHNPVLLAEDLTLFAEIVRRRGLSEDIKPKTRDKLAGRVQLFHEIIAAGLRAIYGS